MQCIQQSDIDRMIALVPNGQSQIERTQQAALSCISTYQETLAESFQQPFRRTVDFQGGNGELHSKLYSSPHDLHDLLVPKDQKTESLARFNDYAFKSQVVPTSIQAESTGQVNELEREGWNVQYIYKKPDGLAPLLPHQMFHSICASRTNASGKKQMFTRARLDTGYGVGQKIYAWEVRTENEHGSFDTVKGTGATEMQFDSRQIHITPITGASERAWYRGHAVAWVEEVVREKDDTTAQSARLSSDSQTQQSAIPTSPM